MGKLLDCELMKIKHTFLQILILVSLIGSIAMITVIYVINDNKAFFEIVKSNSVFVQIIPFAITVIFGCYIVAREYKEDMIIYLEITPQSQVKIMLSKFIVIFLELCLTQILTFFILFIVNTVIDGYDIDLLLKYMKVGLISAGTLSCLVPLMIFISLLRRSFSSASLIFLVIFMLTFPYIFSENGYIFPHLLPMIMVAKFFGSSSYYKISYGLGALILIALAAIFLFLSVVKTKKKE